MPGSIAQNTANTPKFIKMTIQSYFPLVIIEGSVGFYTTHLKWLIKDTGKTVTVAFQVCNARHISGCKTHFIKVIDKAWASGKHHYLMLITTHIFYSCKMYVYLKGRLRRHERGWVRMEVTQIAEAFNVTVLQRIQAVKTQWYASYKFNFSLKFRK